MVNGVASALLGIFLSAPDPARAQGALEGLLRLGEDKQQAEAPRVPASAPAAEVRIPKELAGRIPGLIKAMGDDDFATRERSQKELEKIVERFGGQTLPYFAAAAGGDDPEIERRARAVTKSLVDAALEPPALKRARELARETHKSGAWAEAQKELKGLLEKFERSDSKAAREATAQARLIKLWRTPGDAALEDIRYVRSQLALCCMKVSLNMENPGHYKSAERYLLEALEADPTAVYDRRFQELACWEGLHNKRSEDFREKFSSAGGSLEELEQVGRWMDQVHRHMINDGFGPDP